ncbi:MAG: hypothetical protein KAY37_11435 [Phycisphaerae bacterium]|nr:hypothetical protein [Phycisphaerae bacterium]
MWQSTSTAFQKVHDYPTLKKTRASEKKCRVSEKKSRRLQPARCPARTVLVALVLFAGVPQVAPADESLAAHVPGDVGLFIELREAHDLLIPLIEPEIWSTLAEIAGQKAREEDTSEWSRRVERTVNMTPAEAIRKLFSQRIAFVGEGLLRSQDAVVLCRPADRPRELIRGWPVQPLPTSTRTSVYRLPYRVGLAIDDRLMVFGDNTTGGMFSKVLGVLESGSEDTLAENRLYQSLLARVPKDPDGVFFARLSRSPATTAPAATRPAPPELPGPLRGSKNVLLALHRKGRLLHFSAVGDAPASIPAHNGTLSKLVAGLPERTLLAWAGRVNYPSLTAAAQTLPEYDLLRIAVQQAPAKAIERLSGALDPAVCVAVGVVSPENRRRPAPPVPALALLLATQNAEAAEREWRTLFHSTLALYKLLSLKATPPRRPLRLDTIILDGTEAEQLDLSTLLNTAPEETPLGELHLSWALDGDVLIIASHSDWLRQILAARHQHAPRLSTVSELTLRSPVRQPDNLFVAQTGPIADLGLLWLRHLELTAPQVLKPDWWRAYQPGGRNPQLGIQVTADGERKRLRVQSVTPGRPAYGILQPGDEIIGCNRRRFTTSQPVQEMRLGLAARRDARYIELYVEHGGGLTRVRRVPLPFVDPIQVLRRVVSLGQIVQRVVYTDGVPNAAGPRGVLTLEMRGGEKPLFAFSLSPTASQPR